MAYELPPLAYANNALEPHIDGLTMEIHHDKHRQRAGEKFAMGAIYYKELRTGFILEDSPEKKLVVKNQADIVSATLVEALVAARQQIL